MVFTRHTQPARVAVVQAQDQARRYGHRGISPGHLLLGVLSVSDAPEVAVVTALDLTRERVEQQLRDRPGEPGE